MSDDSAFSLKRLLVGKPIPSSMAHHERLSRVTGLAVLSSDALSSVAYATDFILSTLIVAGIGAFSYAIPISLVIAALLAIGTEPGMAVSEAKAYVAGALSASRPLGEGRGPLDHFYRFRREGG